MTETLSADSAAALQRAAAQLRSGKPEEAILSLRDLLHDEPENLAALHLLGICQRVAGRLDQAIQLQQSILQRQPGFATAHQELGLCLHTAGRSDEAIAAFRSATQADPQLVNSWKFLGDLLLMAGRVEEAAHAYRQYPPQPDTDPMLARGLELLNGLKPGLADRVLRAYVDLHPRDARALHALSQVATHTGAITDALALLESCLAVAPEMLKARFDYVNLLSRRQRYAEALQEVEKLLLAQPADLQFRTLKAALLDRSGQFEPARDLLVEMVRENPRQASLWTGLATVQRTLGDQGGAIASLRHAIDLQPQQGEAWYLLADLKTFEFSAAQVEAMRGSLNRVVKNSADEIHFSFALARALETRGEADGAFDHYLRGNAAKAKTVHFDPSAFARSVEAIRASFSAPRQGQSATTGHPDSSPIFIVGLPRSGTTLVDQVLSSHPQVDGTMELAHLSTLVKEFNYLHQKQGRAPYPQGIADAEADELAHMGIQYLERTRILRGDAPFFIDKMPDNFLHAGLISLILPRARIIDVRRNAMATGFSAFRQLFRFGQEWSYDLAHIGVYYRQYLALMDHWDAVLPGQVHRVEYEALVQDPETVIRHMLESLELPFDAACLAHERNPRAVRTASSEQVRMPMYGDSVDYWKRFEHRLEPLRRALDADA